MNRLDRMEVASRKAKVLEQMEERISKLEEAAANAAAHPAPDLITPMTPEEMALLKGFIYRKLEFIAKNPNTEQVVFHD